MNSYLTKIKENISSTSIHTRSFIVIKPKKFICFKGCYDPCFLRIDPIPILLKNIRSFIDPIGFETVFFSMHLFIYLINVFDIYICTAEKNELIKNTPIKTKDGVDKKNYCELL